MVLSGKGEAFVPLVTPYRRSLLSLAFRQTGNWEDAAEVTQETLLRAFKYLRKFNTAGSFKNWIFQILINESRNFQRRRAKVRRILDMARAAVPDRSTGEASRPRDGESGSPLPSTAADPERETLRRELRTRFLECLDGLGRREKEVFLLRDIEGLTIEETRQVLKCSSVSVRVNLSSARRKIRAILIRRFPEMAKEDS